nr:uncharacterized mitochondrial protein AtMg00810-like [Tanacetum cinerariifolium]
MALTFADTHNMIAFLTTSDASEGFDQVIDFLNASVIKYAFTKVIITEDTVREALHLDDADSIDCLLNEEIFTELARMRVGKGFSGVETPLFEGIIVAQQAKYVADEGAAGVDVDDVPAADAKPTIPSPTPTTQSPPPSQEQEKPSTSQVIPTPPPSLIAQPSSPPQQQQHSQPTYDAGISLDLLHTLLETCTTLTKKVETLEQDKVGTAQRVESSEDTVMDDVSKQGEIIANMDADEDVTLKDIVAVDKEVEVEKDAKVLSMQDDELEQAELKEVVEVVTTAKLMTEVVTTDAAIIIAVATAALTITTAPSAARRKKGVIMVQEPKPLKKQAQIEQDEAYTRELEAKLNKNINWDEVIEHTKEQLEEEESRALKRKAESSEEKAAKKQKLDEEVEELRKHLQIVPNDDDDVYTEATPLDLKKCSWFSKGQKLEIVRVSWSAYYNIHYNTDDFAGREKISIDEVHSRSNAQQYPLCKFNGKVDDGFLVGYSVSSKAFKVFNSRTCIVQETLHLNFLENKPNVIGSSPTWLFDIDTLTKSRNYQPVTTGNQSNHNAGVQEQFDAKKAKEGNVLQYVLFPLWSSGSKDPQNTDDDATFEVKEPKFEVEKPESEVHVCPSSSAMTKKHDAKTKREAKGKSPVVNSASTPVLIVGQISTNSTNTFSAAGPSNTDVSPIHGKSSYVDPSQYLDDPNMPALEDITNFDDKEDVGAEADFTNLETTITASPIPTTRVHKDHSVTQIIGDLSSATQTRSMTRMVKDQGGLTQINNEDFHTCMFSCFLSQEEPKRVYVDGIIFGSTNKDLCKAFEKLTKDKFQMSLMGELTFFLDLQVKQKQDGIFIIQDKYVAEILRNFSLIDGKSASTPIDTEKPLLKDLDREDVDVHTNRSMIGSLMYLTSSRPDIIYLKGKPHLGLWYPKDLPFNLVAYSDSDYAGASLDRKSTIGGCQFLGYRLISWQCKKQTVVATSSIEAEYVVAASYCAQYEVIEKDITCYKCLKCWLNHHTSNGSQFTMSNPHEELTSPDQMVSGKDSSNSLMADNLPKIIWYSTHHVALMKS